MKTFNVEENPAKAKSDVINVWDRYLPRIQNLETSQTA